MPAKRGRGGRGGPKGRKTNSASQLPLGSEADFLQLPKPAKRGRGGRDSDCGRQGGNQSDRLSSGHELEQRPRRKRAGRGIPDITETSSGSDVILYENSDAAEWSRDSGSNGISSGSSNISNTSDSSIFETSSDSSGDILQQRSVLAEEFGLKFDIRVRSLYSRTDLLNAMGGYILEVVRVNGYVEDYFWANVRIMLCLALCGIGMYSWFWCQFQRDRHILTVLLVVYHIINGLVFGLDYWIIAPSISYIKVGEGSAFVDVNLPTFSHEVTISLRSRSKTQSHTCSVARYFDTDGFLRDVNLFIDVMHVITKYTQEEPENENKKKQ